MPRLHPFTVVHRNAQKVIAFLDGEDGRTSLNDPQLAALLGMTKAQFRTAKRHTRTCSTLGGFMVSYRRRNGELVLVEPTATAILVDLVDRSMPLIGGYDAQQLAAATVRRNQVQILKTASLEARAGGKAKLADCYDSAANDVRTTGRLHPMTVAQFRSLGVTI